MESCPRLVVTFPSWKGHQGAAELGDTCLPHETGEFSLSLADLNMRGPVNPAYLPAPG